MKAMFNIGFSEMLLLALIALVVLGPKQIPEVARAIGRFMTEIKRASNVVTAEFRDIMHEEESKIRENPEQYPIADKSEPPTSSSHLQAEVSPGAADPKQESASSGKTAGLA